MSVPAITLQCHLQDMFGNLNQGSILFQLINPTDKTIPRVANTSTIVTSLEIQADATGLVSTPIWGNDVIIPAGTFYCVTFKDAQGGTVASILYRFIGGGVQDLSNIIPLSGIPTITPAPPNAIISNPSGQQQIVGFPLLAVIAGLVIVPWGATPVYDCSLGSAFKIVMNGNTAPSVINPSAGQRVSFTHVQDATGNRVLTYPANVINGELPLGNPNSRIKQIFEVEDDLNLYALAGPSII